MKLITVDFETEGLEARYDKSCGIRCVGFYNKTFKKVLSSREAEAKLWELADTHKLIIHNASFDMSVIRTHYGTELYEKLQFHDTQVMAYCIDTTQGNSLEALASKYFDDHKISIDDFRTVDIRRLAKRCIKDCELTYELYKVLDEELKVDENAYLHYKHIELPYVKLIIEMELNGLGIDLGRLEWLEKALNRLSSYVSKKLHKSCYTRSHVHWKGQRRHGSMLLDGSWYEPTYSNIAGQQVWEHTKLEVWNTGSSTQNAEVIKKLYPRVDFEFRKTKDGKLTVDSKELSDWAKYYKLPVLTQLASKNRQTKLLEFCTSLSNNAVDGRIYASMNQCVTRTGRLSSSKPNLQNIPARGSSGAKFRKLFVPGEGRKLIVGDLDRIELVVLAHYLEEYGFSTYMAEAIRAGDDIHSINAESWNCPRDMAKKVIFTLVYGGGDLKLAITLGIPVAQVREIKQAIFRATGLEEFRASVILSCRRNKGVLHDILGRRLCVPEILSSNQEKRAAGERRINNYLIQGSAGSIFKVLQLTAKDNLGDMPVDLLNVVHDEALYEADGAVAEEAAPILTESFSNDDLLNVPIRAEFHTGTSWYAAKVA